MVEIDPLTGLPKELGIGEILAKESQRIKIRKVKRRFGKIATVIEGLTDKQINLKQLAKKLKNSLACGGTFDKEQGIIELQGDHRIKAKKILIEEGFNPDSIEVE
ncbi:stress response translation initiation inhibitor YciH [Candidatus Woesearchaeota archaeon]|nr:stress response translation initiation inhibitor YciH [Candidatus Woesearchaeota archaeon]